MRTFTCTSYKVTKLQQFEGVPAIVFHGYVTQGGRSQEVAYLSSAGEDAKVDTVQDLLRALGDAWPDKAIKIQVEDDSMTIIKVVG